MANDRHIAATEHKIEDFAADLGKMLGRHARRLKAGLVSGEAIVRTLQPSGMRRRGFSASSVTKPLLLVAAVGRRSIGLSPEFSVG